MERDGDVTSMEGDVTMLLPMKNQEMRTLTYEVDAWLVPAKTKGEQDRNKTEADKTGGYLTTTSTLPVEMTPGGTKSKPRIGLGGNK